MGALSGKVAVVTGAGRGIGQAIALAYGEAGAAVACLARTEDEIGDTAGRIRAAGGESVPLVCDVTDPDTVARVFGSLGERFGGLDLAVLNAGVGGPVASVERSDAAAWTRVLEVNLFGAYHCARAAIPLLKRRGGGRIVLVGSGLGHHGMARQSAYACSKAGLWMLTRVLADELVADRISVNELIPGPVDTRAAREHPDPDGVFTIATEWIKTPEDVAPLALFLATHPEPGPTGQSFSLMRRTL